MYFNEKSILLVATTASLIPMPWVTFNICKQFAQSNSGNKCILECNLLLTTTSPLVHVGPEKVAFPYFHARSKKDVLTDGTDGTDGTD